MLVDFMYGVLGELVVELKTNKSNRGKKKSLRERKKKKECLGTPGHNRALSNCLGLSVEAEKPIGRPQREWLRPQGPGSAAKQVLAAPRKALAHSGRCVSAPPSRRASRRAGLQEPRPQRHAHPTAYKRRRPQPTRVRVQLWGGRRPGSPRPARCHAPAGAAGTSAMLFWHTQPEHYNQHNSGSYLR